MAPSNAPKNKKEFSWGRLSKTLSFWILILLIPVVLIQLSGARDNQAKQITYSQYLDELSNDNIVRGMITAGKVVTGDLRQAHNIGAQGEVRKFTVRWPVENSQAEVDKLNAHHVQIDARDASVSVAAWIVNFLPWLLLFGF